MRRLIDKVEDGAGMERLTELVSAAEPFRPNPFTKRRMLLHLKRESGGQRPFLKAWVTPIGLMFIVGSAIAGTGWWRARTDLVHPDLAGAPTSMPSPAVPAASSSAVEPPLPSEAAPSNAGARESDGPPPKSNPAKRRASTARETTASHAPASNDPIPLPRPAADGEDPTPVVRAIRALRSERNPAQAEQLLQQYLRTNPHGALAEDALALLIETASALRSPSAADRAARYLELYPNGRYRGTARRVLSARP